MINITSLPTFKQEHVQLDDLSVHGYYDEKGKFKVKTINVGDRPTAPTPRFWNSLCSRFGIGLPVFNYFSHKEVFDRIQAKSRDANIKVTIQDTPATHERSTKEWTPNLLGIASNKTSTIQSGDVVDILNELGNASDINYLSGRIVSMHSLKRPFVWDVGGDQHECFIYADTPIDGYGQPKLLLALNRLRCLNQLVAACKSFSASVTLGRTGCVGTLHRAIESYSNEQGFIGLRDRLASSQKSWASMNECVQLAKIVGKLTSKDVRPDFVAASSETVEDPSIVKHNALDKLYKLTGDMREIYGVAQLDVLSIKQQRMIPSKATVYDLICLATEIATYQLVPDAAEKMQRFVGNLVGTDIYDLENSCDEFREFSDFMDDKNKALKKAS